ncbi:MAG: hypothetical protein OEQ53_20670, partial [Saprospiraceae bacterium]|nr:hypothetical protein [Saprospiraceae bacterium]
MYLRLCLLGWYIILPGSCKQAEIHDLHALSEIDPHLLLRDGEKLFQYWEIQEQDQLWGLETGEVGAIDAYAKDLKEALGNDAFTITLGKEQSQKEQLEAYTRFDTINNYDLVHEGYLGKIRKINFIEAQILNY